MVGADEARCRLVADELDRSGLHGRCVHSRDAALEHLSLGGIDAAVVIEDTGSGASAPLGWTGDLAVEIRDRLIPVLTVVVPQGDWRARARAGDSWALSTATGQEIVLRAMDLLEERLSVPPAGNREDSSAFISRLLGMVVHDLRTPLNVIGLTLRAIEQTNANPSPELVEDLGFLHDNARQIERLLAQLGEYCRLLEGGDDLSLVDFEPRTFFNDLVDEIRSRPGAESANVHLEIAPDCPGEVTLDPSRTRLAVQQALSNARTAAAGAPIRLKVSGGGLSNRLLVEVEVQKAPPSNLQSVTLTQDRFERLAGTAAERRGLDLAIAAWVSARFGGSSRLDVSQSRGTTLVFDWPARVANPYAHSADSAR